MKPTPHRLAEPYEAALQVVGERGSRSRPPRARRLGKAWTATGLKRELAVAQRLVENSAKTLERFAGKVA